MLVVLCVLAILTSLIAMFYCKYTCDRVLARFSIIEAIPNLYDVDWWLNDE